MTHIGKEMPQFYLTQTIAYTRVKEAFERLPNENSSGNIRGSSISSTLCGKRSGGVKKI
jgi:hypothetical protein